MEFALSEDQIMLQDSLRGVMTAASPLDSVREVAAGDTGLATTISNALAEMGTPGLMMPKLERLPTPRYPEMARRFNKSNATVAVRVLVDENGKVIKTELAGKPQKFGFDTEAMSAARKSQWKAGTKDGVPVKVWHTLSIEFRR